MRALFVFFILFSFWQTVFAQKDSVRTQADTAKVRTDGEIKLSDSFMKALEGAFSLEPINAPLPKHNDLTVEQLHEWVGRPTIQDTANNASKFNETYKALKMWEKEFYQPVNLNKPKIMLDLGPMPNPNKGKATFDFNELGKYIRPKEIRLRKVRKRAERLREELDEIYPLK